MSLPTTEKFQVSAPLCLSVREAASALRISPRTVNRLVSCGELPSLKIGQRRLVARDALERFVAARQSA